MPGWEAQKFACIFRQKHVSGKFPCKASARQFTCQHSGSRSSEPSLAPLGRVTGLQVHLPAWRDSSQTRQGMNCLECSPGDSSQWQTQVLHSRALLEHPSWEGRVWVLLENRLQWVWGKYHWNIFPQQHSLGTTRASPTAGIDWIALEELA